MKVRRPKCSFCGRKIRDWKKVHEVEITVPRGFTVTVRVCEECKRKMEES